MTTDDETVRSGSAPDPTAAAATEPVVAGPDAVAFSTTRPGPSRRRVGVVAGAAVALAVGAVATSLAASPAADPMTAATGASGTTDTRGGSLSIPADPLVEFDEGTVDRGMRGTRGGFGDITISAISGSNVTLRTEDGWTRTIAVTADVEITKAGQTIALGDLAVGDEIRFSQTRNDDGTWTVERIAVVTPRVSGTVSDVSSSGFKVTTRDGSVWTVTVNASTAYRFGTGEGSLADVTAGDRALVLGTTTGDNAITALTVAVSADRASGTVTSKTASTIVIQQRDGTSVTVHVDGDTTYHVRGAADATLADVAVDMRIVVSGRERADGSIDADAVAAGNGRGFLRGFGDGFRRGGGRDDEASPSSAPTSG